MVVDTVADTEVVVDNNATSAPRLATSPVTAQRLVAMVETRVTEVTKVVTVVDSVAVPVKEAKPASHVAVTDIFPVTAPKVKSATTVVKLVTYPVTAAKRPLRLVDATNVSKRVTRSLIAL